MKFIVAAPTTDEVIVEFDNRQWCIELDELGNPLQATEERDNPEPEIQDWDNTVLSPRHRLWKRFLSEYGVMTK
jgi:hypothetical protein